MRLLHTQQLWYPLIPELWAKSLIEPITKHYSRLRILLEKDYFSASFSVNSFIPLPKAVSQHQSSTGKVLHLAEHSHLQPCFPRVLITIQNSRKKKLKLHAHRKKLEPHKCIIYKESRKWSRTVLFTPRRLYIGKETCSLTGVLEQKASMKKKPK